jgi:hypothetical protein
VAFGVAVFVCVFGLAGAARADEGLVQYASAGGSVFEQPALSDQELSQQRGAGLNDEGAASSGDGDSLAVILWDEWKPKGNGGGSSISYSYGNGVNSSVSSTITGQAY